MISHFNTEGPNTISQVGEILKTRKKTLVE